MSWLALALVGAALTVGFTVGWSARTLITRRQEEWLSDPVAPPEPEPGVPSHRLDTNRLPPVANPPVANDDGPVMAAFAGASIATSLLLTLGDAPSTSTPERLSAEPDAPSAGGTE